MSDRLADRVRLSLRVEMARQQINTARLAEAVGASDMWVSRRLRGETDMTVSDLDRLAEALGVPVDTLLAERAA